MKRNTVKPFSIFNTNKSTRRHFPGGSAIPEFGSIPSLRDVLWKSFIVKTALSRRLTALEYAVIARAGTTENIHTDTALFSDLRGREVQDNLPLNLTLDAASTKICVRIEFFDGTPDSVVIVHGKFTKSSTPPEEGGHSLPVAEVYVETISRPTEVGHYYVVPATQPYTDGALTLLAAVTIHAATYTGDKVEDMSTPTRLLRGVPMLYVIAKPTGETVSAIQITDNRLLSEAKYPFPIVEYDTHATPVCFTTKFLDECALAVATYRPFIVLVKWTDLSVVSNAVPLLRVGTTPQERKQELMLLLEERILRKMFQKLEVSFTPLRLSHYAYLSYIQCNIATAFPQFPSKSESLLSAAVHVDLNTPKHLHDGKEGCAPTSLVLFRIHINEWNEWGVKGWVELEDGVSIAVDIPTQFVDISKQVISMLSAQTLGLFKGGVTANWGWGNKQAPPLVINAEAIDSALSYNAIAPYVYSYGWGVHGDYLLHHLSSRVRGWIVKEAKRVFPPHLLKASTAPKE